MLNGLKALFTSGIIFRPMVFSGIIAGFLLSAFLDMEEAFPLFSDLSFYLLSAAWSGLYTLFFNQIYNTGAGWIIRQWAEGSSATCCS